MIPALTVVTFLAAMVASAYELIPGWALAVMATAGIALVIWADPLEGDEVDYADEEPSA